MLPHMRGIMLMRYYAHAHALFLPIIKAYNKITRMKNRVLLFLFFFFSLLAINAKESDETFTVVTIESAQTAEYRKDENSGDDCLYLSGNVRLSVEKGGEKSAIGADEVNYNRKTQILHAIGNVSVETSTDGKSGDKISANSLLLNTSTMEGIFDSGRAVQASSDAINLPSGSTLIVISRIFARNAGGTIAFKSGDLTFCDEDDPHWKIKASRIWLLPGGEFAFLNARIFVGEFPLLYLPAFYYPKDELIFHPVFGYKSREGYYFQTTTYLYGRKGKEESDESEEDTSYLSFVNTGTLKEQEREGLVLHNLDTDFTGDTEHYAKIMADYYTNLGYLVGFDSALSPSKTYLTKLNFSAELAQSSTIFKNGTSYITASPATVGVLTKGDIHTDHSYFLGYDTKYRYGANLEATVEKPFSLSVSLPVYSDPYFKNDFLDRSETMDWIDFIMQGNTDTSETSDEETTTDTSAVDSFTWDVTGSYSATLPDFLYPWLTDFSITSFNSNAVFTSVNNTAFTDSGLDTYDTSYMGTYSPERMFYYPSSVTPLKLAFNIAGTLFEYPAKEKSAEKTEVTFPLPLISPSPLEALNKGKEDDKSANDSESALPKITLGSFSATEMQGWNYVLGYTIKPVYTTQVTYATPSLPDEFRWNDYKSTYFNFTSPVTLSSALTYDTAYFSATNSLTFTPVYQEHPYLKISDGDDGYTQSSADTVKKTDYSARKLDLQNDNTFSYKPLYYNQYFKNTALSYNSTVKIVRTSFIGNADKPEWEYLTLDLSDEDCVSVNKLTADIASEEGDFSQKLSLSSTLPPVSDEYTGTLTFGFPYFSTTASTGIKKDSDTDEWEKEDLKQSATLSAFDSKLKLTESFNFNLEEWYKDSLQLSLTAWDFQAAFTMSYMYGSYMQYDNSGNAKGWASYTEKEFLPKQLSFAYANTKKTFRRWKNRISVAPLLSTAIVYDYQKPTSSYFTFVPSITFRVHNFFDLTFSSESRNDVIYRYFQKYSKHDFKLSGETNPVLDLIDSFRFDDEEKRRATGFKLKNLKMTITHDLHDWDISSSLTIKPRLLTDSETSKKYYDFSPYFTISVAWRPMGAMKTTVEDKYGEWTLNP